MSVLPRLVRRPEAGYDVEAVRRILIRAGLRRYTDPGGVKRPMGLLLESQVRAFQRRHGITPSGVVGSATWLKMQRLDLVKSYEQWLVDQERLALQRANTNRVADLVISAARQGATAMWEPTIHYSQDAILRWRGIQNHWLAPDNQPDYADCSSYTTWLFWQARTRVYGDAGADVINGDSWRAGYTGTQAQHGRAVAMKDAIAGQTLVFYGPSWDDTHHVVVWIGPQADHPEWGTNVVVSHGQENGPRITNAFYRADLLGARAYSV